MISKYEHFSLSVSCIYHDIQRIERTEMEKFGLKGPHAQTLLVMRRHPQGITSVQLCEICEKDKAAVSRSVAELEEKGMIIRNQVNGSTYRAKLTLTEQGIAAADAVSERARQAVEQAGVGLSDDKRQVFYEVMALIAGNLHAICKDGLKDHK